MKEKKCAAVGGFAARMPREALSLFAWGANSYGQLGIGRKSEQSETPTELPDPPPDVEACAGGGHSLASG